MTYGCLFAIAAMHRSGVPAAIIALGVTVLGLSAVNVSDALGSVLDGRSTLAYWPQTGLIAALFRGADWVVCSGRADVAGSSMMRTPGCGGPVGVKTMRPRSSSVRSRRWLTPSCGCPWASRPS